MWNYKIIPAVSFLFLAAAATPKEVNDTNSDPSHDVSLNSQEEDVIQSWNPTAKGFKIFGFNTCMYDLHFFIFYTKLSHKYCTCILPAKSPSSRNRFLCAAETRTRSWNELIVCWEEFSIQMYAFLLELWSISCVCFKRIAQQRMDSLILSMRTLVGEGVRRTHQLLIDFVELAHALHLNFEMKLLPLLLLKID